MGRTRDICPPAFADSRIAGGLDHSRIQTAAKIKLGHKPGLAMSKTLRNFKCPWTNEPCDDPRCKRGHCAQEQAASAERQELVEAEREEYKWYIKSYATELLRKKGIKKPTYTQLETIMNRRDVYEKAIELAKEEEKLINSIVVKL